MTDIEELFEAISPDRRDFSELTIIDLVNKIVRNDPKRAEMLLEELTDKLRLFLNNVVNSKLHGGLTRRHCDLEDKMHVCSLRFLVECKEYKYDYLNNVWKGTWMPYIDITYGMFPPIEPFDDGKYRMYEFVSRGKGSILFKNPDEYHKWRWGAFIPFKDPKDYLEWRWEAFKRTNPIFVDYDNCKKDLVNYMKQVDR